MNIKNKNKMDLDYHLLNSKDLDEEEKKDTKDKKDSKEHSSAYFRFINKFKNHLKKIENNFSGDEINPLNNHFNFINKCENDIEEQRENCLNCYKALKEQLSLIEKFIPNFDINLFNTFFQTFEEYYSFFTKTKEILKTFAKFNDDTQNLYYICKKKNFCIDALKEYIEKISEEYADKIEKYDLLNERFKELTESYEKLYKIYNESKNKDFNSIENINNEKLMISKLNQKIQELTIENDRINKKFLECSRELERLGMNLKINYILKSESESKINEYKFKMSHFENESIRIKQEIRNIKKENEKLIEQKEYFENKINSELNFYENNNSIKEESNFESKSNNDNLIEENKNEEEEELESGKDLQNLLMNCEEYESEEYEEEKKEEIEKNDNSNKNEQKQTSISININNTNEKENIPENIENKENENINNQNKKYKKSKTVRFIHKNSSIKKSINLNKYNSKKSDDINSAYNLMYKGRHLLYSTRIAAKDNRDYFKQFFFLLFQSMKLNSDNIGNFLGYNPEILYNECRKQHTPFHKYQRWIERKLFKKENIENSKKYEDFKTITGIFCSSLI